MEVIEFLKYLAFLCWSFCTVFVLLGGIAWIFYKPKRRRKRAENVEYVIISVANRKVEKSLNQTIEHTKKMLGNPWLVVDEGSELIPKLSKENSMVIVPESYRRDLTGKGRAINYFIEKKVESDKWYAFIDDDNLVLDDAFLYEIPYYQEEGYVALNPILVPRSGKSLLTYIMDHIRYFDDLFVYRFCIGFLRHPLIGFHGELLCVRGSILKEIGFGNRSLTEDFRFASEVVKKGYLTWQSTTRVSIKSPNSLGDLLKQRGRWFKGVLMDWRYCPVLMKGFVGSRLLIWIFSIFGSFALSPLWLFWDPFYFAIPGGILELLRNSEKSGQCVGIYAKNKKSGRYVAKYALNCNKSILLASIYLWNNKIKKILLFFLYPSLWYL